MSDSMWPHGLQHTRLSSPSPSPRASQLTFTELVMPSHHLILCHSLLLLPSIFSSIKFFSNESALRIQWLKYWSFSVNIRPSSEYSELISLRTDWFDLLAGLSSLLHHNYKASVLPCSVFFLVQLSHPYMTTGKALALTGPTFFSEVMSLLLNALSKFVLSFLPRSKCPLISWLQSPSALILESNEIKSVTVSIVSPSLCHEVMGPDAMISVSPVPALWQVSTLSCVCIPSRLAAALSALPLLPSVPLSCVSLSSGILSRKAFPDTFYLHFPLNSRV